MDRQVVHINVAEFPVAVERVIDRSLRTRPVAVASGQGPRAVIASVSPEAKAEGVHRGMRVAAAHKYCRSLRVLPPNPQLYRRANDALLCLTSAYCPLVEPTRPGHLFLDITGTHRLFGPALDMSAGIQREIAARLRLGAAVGLACNKLVSRIAAHSIPPVNLHDVPTGNEAVFLAPFPLRRLPAVRTVSHTEMFELLNLNTIGQMAAVALHQLIGAFGQRGYVLHEQAMGIDNTPVLPPETKPFIAEQRTLSQDSNCLDELADYLRSMTEQVGMQLRRKSTGAKTLKLTLRYSDGETVTRQRRTKFPASDNTTLFGKLYGLLTGLNRRTRIQWMQITALDIVQAAQQLYLFPPKEGENGRHALSATMDAVRSRFGNKAIQYASARDRKQ